jgi:predicted deacetylase
MFMDSLPDPAQYLLRIDDLCPTVHPERWSSIREVIREFGLRPILAVVPDNQDESLAKSRYDARFWEEVRILQREGATIAMHGYRHVCSLRSRSLIPLHRHSEFAGRSLKTQREFIRSGLAVLRNEALEPRLFVAPRHSFDRMTLRALCQEGLPYLSDGLARVPFKRDGVTWIPQQLWSPASRAKGLWTLCIHPNSAGPRRLAELRGFVEKYRDQFTSFNDVIANFSAGKLSLGERMNARIALWRIMRRVRRNRTAG